MIDSYEDFKRVIDMAEHFYLDREYTQKGPVLKNISETGKDVPARAVADSIEIISSEVKKCTKCALAKTRTNTVPGMGPDRPSLMIIGEAPGADEDKQGIPFVGKAGQYLDKWLEAIELTRDKDVFIGNILKCRPPGNRDPLPEECSVCSPFLLRQIELLKPKVILTLGRIAAQYMLKTETGITRLRGKVYYFNNIPLVPTFHPAAVLRNPDYRKDVWFDLKLAREQL